MIEPASEKGVQKDPGRRYAVRQREADGLWFFSEREWFPIAVHGVEITGYVGGVCYPIAPCSLACEHKTAQEAVNHVKVREIADLAGVSLEDAREGFAKISEGGRTMGDGKKGTNCMRCQKPYPLALVPGRGGEEWLCLECMAEELHRREKDRTAVEKFIAEVLVRMPAPTAKDEGVLGGVCARCQKPYNLAAEVPGPDGADEWWCLHCMAEELRRHAAARPAAVAPAYAHVSQFFVFALDARLVDQAPGKPGKGKGDEWHHDDIYELAWHLVEEVGELARVLWRRQSAPQAYPREVQRECLDVAAMAMMVWDAVQTQVVDSGE